MKMDREKVFQSMVEIARDVFENDTVELTEKSTAADIEGWDSLTHLSLVNELEEKYGIGFTLDEVAGSKNLGELLNALMKHLSEKSKQGD